MKLKCNHGRRVMVLASGTTIHREDGTKCRRALKMGDKTVFKMFSNHDVPGVPAGTCILAVQGKDDMPWGPAELTPGENLLKAIFTKPITANDIDRMIGNPLI